MKKFLLTLLMLLYLIPAVGVNLSAHFCGQELASIHHSVTDADKCLCGIQPMKKSCCEDKQLQFKIDDNQQKAELLSPKFSNPFHVPFTIPAILELTFVYPRNENRNHSFYNPPEPYYKQDIYLLNNVLRI
ncbi:MAG: hypothetical protein E2604_08570 [Flavobacterium sp.]|nr:hypothetical protein [Flavobacterium sp.]